MTRSSRGIWRRWGGVEDGARWRGWSGDEGVTSTRLTTGAPVHNRLFPKVRSWFALGAPLELLSPLSLLRIIVLLLLIVEAVALAAGTPRPVPAITLLLVTAAGVVALLRVRDLAQTTCHLGAGMAAAAAAAIPWVTGGADVGLVGMVLLVPLGVFAGLFFRIRTILRDHAALGVVVVGGLVVGGYEGDLVGAVATTALVSALTAALVVALTSRAARRQSTIDADTGLPNGYGLAELHAARIGASPFVVATLVLRGLAEAREALGYRAGTELLRRAVEDVGQVLPPAALVGRVDGDELVVLLPVLEHGDGEELAGLLIRGIGSGRYLVAGIEVTLRAHVGSAVAPLDGHDVTELVRRASLSARSAHDRGAGHLRWDGTTGAFDHADLSMLADLRHAVERGKLTLAYQPQIDARSDRIIAVEALLRWESPRHGSVSPGIFIPLAERTGLIDRLTDWVLAEALDAQVRWRASGVHVRVGINISAVSLSDPTLPDRCLEELRRRGLPPTVLAIEVTETAALDVVQGVERLGPLHDAGVRVAIDDFGTGYTSLSVLPRLPLDELKVDQRFVLASSESPADEAIVAAVVDLGHRLALEVVAEGVETEAFAERMVALGCDILQGYHFSRPLPEAELLTHLSRERARMRPA